jgi:hypothetical protein
MRTFQAAPESEAWNVVHRHPLLLLPELAEAAERALGKARAIDGLREMHHALRATPLFAPYHRLLARALAGERSGSRRVNLERARAVMKDVRAAAQSQRDPEDDRIDDAIRAAIDALTPLPAPRPLAHALFLDDVELAGFRRRDDRRDVNPNEHDRAFATQGGLAAGSAEWLGDEASALYRLVDARWMFSSSKTAKAYLNAPGTLQLASDDLPNRRCAVGDAGPGAARNTEAIRRRTRGKFCCPDRPGRGSTSPVRSTPQAFRCSQPLLRHHAEAVIRRVRYVSPIARRRPRNRRGATLSGRRRVPHSSCSPVPDPASAGFPTAMSALTEQHRAAAERLASAQAMLKIHWQKYREVVRALVQLLLDETAGDPKVNADAAYRLVVAHRRLDSDYAWAALETECSART